MNTGTLELITLAEPNLKDGDPEFPPFDDDNRHNRGCNTEWAACGAIPTHHITFYTGDDDETEAHVFCERHYAVELAHFAMVHPVENHCDTPVREHIAAYGAIADIGER